MPSWNELGIGGQIEQRDRSNPIEHVLFQRPLQRVLAFTRRTIDDVINNPLARREVYGYYKLYRTIERASETRDLERQWNPLGR